MKLVGFAVALLVMAIVFWHANQAASYLPIVDGWAVLDRIMRFADGDMTWQEYLFRPHGAHLHAIVYLLTWVDFHYFTGQQLFIKTVSYAATASVCLFFTAQIIRYGIRANASLSAVSLTIAASIALITGIADTETMLHPFQVVLSVARFVYLLLLWYLIVALVEKNTRLYIAVILLSMIAVTFHGTGYIFAALVIGAHILACRIWRQLIFCLLPFATAVILQSMFSQGGGELSKFDALLTNRALMEFFPAVFAYFATPFVPLIPRVGVTPLLVVGCLAFLTTIVLTIQAVMRSLGIASLWPLGNAWKKSMELRRTTGADKELVFLAVLGFFVLASSAAAAIFWIIRNELSGMSQPASDLVLGSTRYGAFALFAYVMPMLASLRYLAKARDSRLFATANVAAQAFAGVVLVAASFSSYWSLKYYDLDDQLNLSAAAISAGVSPVAPEAEGIWPGGRQDWYWANALPETVANTRFAEKGPWRYTPRLDAKATGAATYVALEKMKVSPVKSDLHGTVCHISGFLATPEFNKLNKSVLLPLVNTAERVVGYAVVTRRSTGELQRPVSGFALCSASPAAKERLLLTMATKWADPESISRVGVAPANMTDGTWLNGVARNWAGYFVLDTPINRNLFSPGRIVRLGDSKIRTVIRQEAANGYLNVFLTGKNLDGGAVGYPRMIIPVN